MPSKEEKIGLSLILEGLCIAGVEFILVGGLAAVVQGAPITTMDVDIVPRQTSDNLSRLLDFLKSIDACHRRLDNKIIPPALEHISGKGQALFRTRLGPLDILAIIEGGRSYDNLIEHTIKIDFRNSKLLVLDLETLVELKKSSKDSKDKQRLSVLKETLRQTKGSYGDEDVY